MRYLGHQSHQLSAATIARVDNGFDSADQPSGARRYNINVHLVGFGHHGPIRLGTAVCGAINYGPITSG